MNNATKTVSQVLSAILLGLLFLLPKNAGAQTESLMWINHLDFLAGDSSVKTSFNAVNSGVGGGLSGLIVKSTTVGENADGGGNKVIQKGLVVPPGYTVNGVRVCYELSNEDSFISQIRLAQIQDPPDSALVLLDDGTDLVDMGPVCVDSDLPPTGPIDPAAGALLLSLRVNFTNPTSDTEAGDSIVIRSVGLFVLSSDTSEEQIDALRQDLENHSHDYLTGRGTGHNNAVATSGPPEFPSEPVPDVTPSKKPIRKPKAQ